MTYPRPSADPSLEAGKGWEEILGRKPPAKPNPNYPSLLQGR
ncbi:MAG: hypothetical protein JWQ02_1729, partial [Capsulimonas sp.]|nr:hypothetical protein [Capsulimonas sp.]